MTWFNVILLAAVQGVAEFLPISSSGHLALLGRLFGIEGADNLSLEIVLHGGTLLSIVIYYWSELIGFVRRGNWHLAAMVIAGSVPAGIAGIAIKYLGLDAGLFGNLYIVGAGFIATGIVLWNLRSPESGGAEKLSDVTLKQALLVGLAQMFAILPGVSRSGTTIVAGTRVGLGKAQSAEFSFLLAIVAIGGALGLDMLDKLRDNSAVSGGETLLLGTGFVVAALVGYAALTGLISTLKKGRWRGFSWYLFALGVLTLILQLWVR